LGNWVAKYRIDHAGEELPLSIAERARLRELEKENRGLKMKADFLGYAGIRLCRCLRDGPGRGVVKVAVTSRKPERSRW
jgi:hypothetical protein